MTEGAAEPPAPLARLWWLPLALAATPMLLGLAILAQQTWYPIGDLGQANLRLLSFWHDPPLVGAAGRIVGEGGVQGNHPGPAQFWLLWPVWALLGGSSWAVNASVAVTNLAGAAVAVACARRLGGPAAAAAIGAVSLVLVAGFGPEVMLQPWNPSMPLLWFLALVVAVWGVLVGHRAMLPVVAGAACYVVQCHAGYAPIALGLCGLAAAGALWGVRQAEDRRAALLRLAPWLAAAAAVAAALWAAPIVQQISNDPGNIDLLRYSFSHPDEDYVGLGRGLQLLLLQLDPTGGWVRGAQPMDGIPVGGVALVAAWVGSAAVARSALSRRIRALDVVLATSLLGAWISISRIFGVPFVYLYKWTWVLCGLVVVATAAHLLAVARARSIATAERPSQVVTVLVAAAVVIGLISGGLRFAATEMSGERYSDTIAGLIEPTTAALDRDTAYLVAWRDPVALGGVGFGMVLELERRGFDVGVSRQFSAAGEPHRVRDDDEVDVVINVVSGERAITEALGLPGAQEIARFDARSAAERARYDELQARAADRLDATGFGEQAQTLRDDGNLFGILLSAELPDDVVADITEMVDLFLPTAVIVSDPLTL